MKKETLFKLLFAIGTIAVGVLCVGTLNYIDSQPSVPDAVETILLIILAIDVICLGRVVKMVWKAIWNGVMKLFEADKKKEEKLNRGFHEKSDIIDTVASTKKPTDWLKEMETIIYDYCERAYHSKPNFPIKLSTNFKSNLNFDGLDMVEIEMSLEEKFSVKIPADHPFNHRHADDTDFTVEDLLAAYGLVEASGRCYFFSDLCSFELSKEDIKQHDVEKNGAKHTIFTESMFMLILEIRPCMPQFPSDVPVKTIKVSGFDCLAAKVGPLATDYNQYFINCRTFVVQVSFSLVSDINKICSFLNSFRLEK